MKMEFEGSDEILDESRRRAADVAGIRILDREEVWQALEDLMRAALHNDFFRALKWEAINRSQDESGDRFRRWMALAIAADELVKS